MKRTLVFTILVGLSWSAPCLASDEGTSTADIERCAEAHDSARGLMLEEKWTAARERLLACEEPACPIAIRSDCGAWLEEIARILPTLLVLVERDDDDRVPVELEIDGRKLELPNPPRPIELSPGTHVVRVGLPGYPTVERIVVLEKGDKNRVVRAAFAREKPAPALQPQPRATRPTPIVTYALAGGAAAALATSVILLGSALSAKDDALERCAPECDSAEADSIEARLLAADLFGVAAVLLGGSALYTFVTRPTVMEAALLPRLELSRHGSRVSIEGRF